MQIAKRYDFPSDSDFRFDIVLNCNMIFNDFTLDIFNDVIRLKNIITPIRTTLSSSMIEHMRDNLIKRNLENAIIKNA